MPTAHPYITNLLHCIALEEKEEKKRYSLDQQHTLKSLKTEGLALHPITVTRKNFGYADYPEISFRLGFPAETGFFRDGTAIECFAAGEEPVKGMLLNLDGKSGSFRLYAPDFPDWIEDKGVGIKLAPDLRTAAVMKTALHDLQHHKKLYILFTTLHGEASLPTVAHPILPSPLFSQDKLNLSQQEAVKGILQNEQLVIVHGPPGTGKTTTLVEAIVQLVKKGEKVLLSAPSNTAVDHISINLIERGINLLRVGNAGKVNEAVFRHTPEGRLEGSTHQKEIKALKKKAEAFRKMALKYKRHFGKAEREQRNLLFKEVKSIRAEIGKLQTYNEEKLYSEANVIAGTPVGLCDAGIGQLAFHSLVIDEAGQCIEPLAWCIFSLAEKYVLAGDHQQLPPTVLSAEAARLGLNKSILETAIKKAGPVFFLDTQYRMRPAIAGFPGNYFYEGRLMTAPQLLNTGVHINFIDTAGSGMQESRASDGTSLQNTGELDLAARLMQEAAIDPAGAVFISPYAGQVLAAREMLPPGMRTSTIDSFQGQEKETVILSLVRSNDTGEIGFLKDYRRMNVAITRAKEQLWVIGDSATIGADPFFRAFLEYAEKHGGYRTVWEFNA